MQYWSSTDFIRQPAQARLELARVLIAIGREDDAISETREAMRLFADKGDRPGAAEALALLDTLSVET